MRFAIVLLLGAGCVQDRPVGPLLPPDVFLPPPSTPEDGFQFSIDPFDIPPGQEIQNCYFFESPYDEDVCIGRIVVTQNTGTHHMNVFRIGTVLELDGEPGEEVLGGNDRSNPCWRSGNWADWPLLVNSQQADPDDATYDWTLPIGVAHRIRAREKLMLQSHYVNANTQAGDTGLVYVNFERVPCEGVQEVGTMFATNQGIDICPGDVDVTFSASCGNDFPEGAHIIAANSHFHSRGTDFTIETYDPVAGQYGEPFYRNRSWDDPLMDTDLDFVVPAGQRIGWHCSYTYQEPASCDGLGPGCCYQFGPVVETSEHCNIFVYYYPKATDYSCI